jgi:hypothetical protein
MVVALILALSPFQAALRSLILPGWRQALEINPTLGETPVAVLCDPAQRAAWQRVPEVRHVLTTPPVPKEMLRWLAAISRWRSFVHELEKRGRPPARLSR